MNKKQERFSWIVYSDKTQCEWALSYLETRKCASKRLTLSVEKRVRDSVSTIVPMLSIAEQILLNQQMKAAWNQKKNRSRTKDRKAYSFIMSTDIERMLKKLARDEGKPINKVLESIIENVSQFKVNIEDVILKRIERVNKANENIWMKQKDKVEKRNLSNQQQLVKLKAIDIFQHDFISSLLFKASEFEFYFIKNDINLKDLGLNGKDRAEVMKDAEDRLAYHLKKLDLHLREIGIYG